MSKINPIYILIFFTAIALLMMYKSSQMQDKISTQAQKNALTMQKGKSVAALQKSWGDQHDIKADIDKILSISALKRKLKSSSLKDGIYNIKLDSLKSRELDILTAKILNENIEIDSIKYRRNADKNVSVEMEFVL